MNFRSFQVGIAIIAVLILTVIGVFQLFRDRILNDSPDFDLPEATATPAVNGFNSISSPSPTPSPVLGTTTPQVQPESGSETKTVNNIGINLTNPTAGTTVTSPVTVTGSANVFEGIVVIRVKDANGTVIGEGNATACMGYDACPFEATVTFSKPLAAGGTIEAFNPSGYDGSPNHLQSVDIRF